MAVHLVLERPVHCIGISLSAHVFDASVETLKRNGRSPAVEDCVQCSVELPLRPRIVLFNPGFLVDGTAHVLDDQLARSTQRLICRLTLRQVDNVGHLDPR